MAEADLCLEGSQLTGRTVILCRIRSLKMSTELCPRSRGAMDDSKEISNLCLPSEANDGEYTITHESMLFVTCILDGAAASEQVINCDSDHPTSAGDPVEGNGSK